jgi:ferric iron reductase protein FhuF
MHSNETPTGWQRQLHFEDEEIWNELPESVREQCRTLWRQVLASVLKVGEGRQNERED